MRVNIKRIIKKEIPTGTDVGRLFMANFVLSYIKASKSNNPANSEDVISPEKIDELWERMKTNEDRDTYSYYTAIKNLIILMQEIAEEFYNYGVIHMTNLIHTLQETRTAECIYNYLNAEGLIKEITLKDASNPYREEFDNVVFPETLKAKTVSDKLLGLRQLDIRDYREGLCRGIYVCRGYNEALKLVASVLKVDEVMHLSKSLKPIEDAVRDWNNNAYRFYMQVKNTTPERLPAFNKLFYPIKMIEEVNIPPESIERAKKSLKARDDLVGFMQVIYTFTPYNNEKPIDWEEWAKGTCWADDYKEDDDEPL